MINLIQQIRNALEYHRGADVGITENKKDNEDIFETKKLGVIPVPAVYGNYVNQIRREDVKGKIIDIKI